MEIKDKDVDYTEKMIMDLESRPGLDKEAAIKLANSTDPKGSPCEYCNRGDCIECSYS